MKLLLAILVLAAALVPASASAATHRCGRIDIDYPNGQGGSSAVDIRATNIACKPARVIVRACQNSKLTKGWHAKFVGDRQVMTSGRRKITFLLAGGGGCGF